MRWVLLGYVIGDSACVLGGRVIWCRNLTLHMRCERHVKPSPSCSRVSQIFHPFSHMAPCPLADGGGGSPSVFPKTQFQVHYVYFLRRVNWNTNILVIFFSIFQPWVPKFGQKSVKNCNHLNFCLPSGTPKAELVPLPGRVRAVQIIHHKKWSKWSKMVQNEKIWVLAEKIVPPPPRP